jgi:hypothetical protein
MIKLRLTAQIVALFSLLATGSACAQASRTWVSGVGDDANPCSRTAPCKTFAGAIAKTAPGGEIDALDPGGFGAVTITKGIIIDGGAGLASILVSGTNAVTINAAAGDTVILRNLSINGLGTGLTAVNYVAGGNVILENVKIQRFLNSLVDAHLTASGSLSLISVTGLNSATI